ncbi:MAG: GntR family transcriptional regulator [Rhodobacterales bacterium]|nr:GntR family transcriptional regulator [Rhodobacterales bacterium]
METGPSFVPLYQQVRGILLGRITDGYWKPGEPLPAEPRIAEELGVSPGTVRKALDDLAAAKVVTRRQGRGTYVTEHSPDTALFHFFRVVNAKGHRSLPDCRELSRHHGKVNARERKALDLPAGAPVYRIRRMRPMEGRDVLIEDITVPATLFPGLIDGRAPLPNTLYDHYQRAYGVTIRRASETLRAVGASDSVARHLGLATGHPVMEIHRVAIGLDEKPIELRITWLATDDFAYHVELE